ncbi:hypothetical protein PIB30_041410, partial [Stylosanthes scabra]|nr:hypothetical protein [Stylosanthes scabra]
FLVEVGEASNPCSPPIAAAPVRIVEPSVPDSEMKMGNSKSNSDYAASSGSSWHSQ